MKNVNQNQTCKLCGVRKDLRNSHVFPEFLYKPTYDKKHRAIRIEIDTKRKILVQKGIREPLLCEECEQHLSKIERRFKNSWYDSGRLPNIVSEDFLVLKGFDYVQFKLFHLSILWRWSVSSIGEFSTVNLGPHEDRIAQLIRAEAAGDECQYRFWGQVLVHDDNRIAHDIVSRPQEAKLEGHRVYYACYGGCEWTFFVSSHSTAAYNEVCFRDDGSIALLRVPFMECNSVEIIAEELQGNLSWSLIDVVRRAKER